MQLSRRKALQAMAVSLAEGPSWATAQTHARPGRKRVVVISKPFFGFTVEDWAELLGAEGLVAGRDIEISVIVETGSLLRVQTVRDSARRALALSPDVIIAHHSGASPELSYLPVTGRVPLVLFGPEDGSGALEAANRRGASVTGVLFSYLQLVEKRYELLKQLRPGARRAAGVGGHEPEDGADPEMLEVKRRLQESIATRVRRLGMDYEAMEFPLGSPPEPVLRGLREARIDVAEIICCSGPPLWERLTAAGIATSTIGPERVREGALLGGWSVGWVSAVAHLVAKIVRGQPASSIPVQFPRKFGLALNLRTARALGIEVPASVLVQAERVFE